MNSYRQRDSAVTATSPFPSLLIKRGASERPQLTYQTNMFIIKWSKSRQALVNLATIPLSIPITLTWKTFILVRPLSQLVIYQEAKKANNLSKQCYCNCYGVQLSKMSLGLNRPTPLLRFDLAFAALHIILYSSMIHSRRKCWNVANSIMFMQH